MSDGEIINQVSTSIINRILTTPQVVAENASNACKQLAEETS